MSEQSRFKEVIQQEFGEAATRGPRARRRGAAAAPAAGAAPITSDLYGEAENLSLRAEAVAASLGCGNPTALIELNEGEMVLDLGSGGGIDVLLSAKRVGPTGKVYGLDMTDEMLALALRTSASGCDQRRVPEGEIEQIPLPDASVDVIISNCVINLSADKGRVLREAFRVLKPGGRFAVSDVVVRGDVPEVVRKSMELWVGCVAGARHEDDYRTLLGEAGFGEVDVEPWRVYKAEDAKQFLARPAWTPPRLHGKWMGPSPAPSSVRPAPLRPRSRPVRAARPAAAGKTCDVRTCP